ncbi:hypothetical protein evm_003736 [Chilo suppressalis]|nr:hypothetical protein evm_003736 [Chilo suppressalis]
MQELIENDKFWEWLVDWTSVYMEALTHHVKNQIKEEVAEQIKEIHETPKEDEEISEQIAHKDDKVEQIDANLEVSNADVDSEVPKDIDRNQSETEIEDKYLATDDEKDKESIDKTEKDSDSVILSNIENNDANNAPESEHSGPEIQDGKLLIDGKEIPMMRSFNFDFEYDGDDKLRRHNNKNDGRKNPDTDKKEPEHSISADKVEANDSKNKMESPVDVKANNLFGNSIGSDHVTNIFIFYPKEENKQSIPTTPNDSEQGTSIPTTTLEYDTEQDPDISDKLEEVNKESEMPDEVKEDQINIMKVSTETPVPEYSTSSSIEEKDNEDSKNSEVSLDDNLTSTTEVNKESEMPDEVKEDQINVMKVSTETPVLEYSTSSSIEEKDNKDSKNAEVSLDDNLTSTTEVNKESEMPDEVKEDQINVMKVSTETSVPEYSTSSSIEEMDNKDSKNAEVSLDDNLTSTTEVNKESEMPDEVKEDQINVMKVSTETPVPEYSTSSSIEEKDNRDSKNAEVSLDDNLTSTTEVIKESEMPDEVKEDQINVMKVSIETPVPEYSASFSIEEEDNKEFKNAEVSLDDNLTSPTEAIKEDIMTDDRITEKDSSSTEISTEKQITDEQKNIVESSDNEDSKTEPIDDIKLENAKNNEDIVNSQDENTESQNDTENEK